MKLYRRPAVRGLFFVAAFGLVPACTTDGDDGDESDSMAEDTDSGADDMTGPLSFAVDVEPIISSSCVASCHEVDGLNESLILTEGSAYDNLIGVMSGQLPQMQIVNPGNKSVSYMWHKLNNTHLAEGGSGAQMPYEGQALPAGELILIGDWIDEGAMP